MMSFGLTACSAVYYHAGSSFPENFHHCHTLLHSKCILPDCQKLGKILLKNGRVWENHSECFQTANRSFTIKVYLWKKGKFSIDQTTFFFLCSAVFYTYQFGPISKPH
jgi:hypothetical protein